MAFEWLGDAAPYIGGIGGAIGGFVVGGPGGAMTGASLGYSGGNALKSKYGSDASDAEEQAHKLATLYDGINYKDPMADPGYAAQMAKLQEYAKGGMTPEDRAREYEALGHAQQFAQGQRGAIEAHQAAMGGGAANTGMAAGLQEQAAQAQAQRLSGADQQTAGMASQRGMMAQQEFMRQMQMNSQMQNAFAMQKAGGQTQNGAAYLNFLGAQQASQQQAMSNFMGGLGQLGAQKLMQPGQAPQPSPAAADAGGLHLGGTPLTQEGGGGFGTFRPTLPVDSTTPSLAGSLAALQGPPQQQGAAPGSAPSTISSTKKQGWQ